MTTTAPRPPSQARFPPPALRVRTYRWFWFTQWPVYTSLWMEMVALGYLVYDVTHSTTAVSIVAAADGLPAIGLSIAGGVLADRVPRRRILLATQSVLGVSAASLALLAGSGHAGLWSIAAIAAVFGSADAIDLPTRQALVADLVERDLVVNAVALGSLTMSAARIVGPSLGGLIIASAGPAPCFALLAVAYLAPIAVLLLVIPDVQPDRRALGTPLGDAVAGIRAAVRDPLVRPVLVCASTLSLLGVSYMPFLPVLARDQLHAGGRVLGLMYSTGGIGGLIAGLLLASMGRGAQRVRLLVGGGLVYAAGLFTLAHSHALLMALPGLVGISFGFLALNTGMQTLLQTEIPPALRGRLLGVYAMVLAALQPLGTLFYGALSARVPLFDAIGVGGLCVGASAVWAATRRPLWELGRVEAVAPG